MAASMTRGCRFVFGIRQWLPFNHQRNILQPLSMRSLSQEVTDEVDTSSNSISSMIAAAQERRAAYDKLLHSEEVAFERSRRHLANMMGEEPENFTQEDIDRAIKYLLPSGLFDPKARPSLRPPKDFYPPQKAAQFDSEGKPFSHFFYTGKPNYYKLMHEAGEWLYKIMAMEDLVLQKGESTDGIPQIMLTRSEWVEKTVIETMLVENLSDDEYSRFIKLLERILQQRFAIEAQEFILKYRRKVDAVLKKVVIQQLMPDENGRLYSIGKARRKNAWAKVTVRDGGTGTITINGQELLKTFRQVCHREEVLFPLQFLDMLDRFDIECITEGVGPSGQSGAIRLGMSKALQSFVDEPFVEKMRQAGLLTTDPRIRERKKPGQARARKKFTWKKR